MKDKQSGYGRAHTSFAIRVLCLFSFIGLLMLTTTMNGAEAARYKPQKAGHPLRIVAYLVHPIGVFLDYGLMRPAYYLVQKEPFATIFGAHRSPEGPLAEDDPLRKQQD